MEEPAVEDGPESLYQIMRHSRYAGDDLASVVCWRLRLSGFSSGVVEWVIRN